jgi:hypothetical protein
MAGSPAQAREANEIYAPIFAQYKSITDARKKLRNKEKKGQAMSGDEYFAMAAACSYEEAPSQSIILTALSRSKCKDLVSDYYLEAGRRGTPEGFLAAAKMEANAHDAFGFAQLAYQLSGEDVALRDQALELMSDLQPRVSNPALANQQSMQISQQLVAGGRYASLRNPAGTQELANIAPRLDWLNFKNPARCEWSEAAYKIFENSVGFDERKARPTVPATVQIPGSGNSVRSRISRPERDAPEYVVIDVDFKGRWNGLTVLGLTDAILEESDGVWGKGIRFAEPVETVSRRLSSAGFVVNANGSRREQADRVENVRYTDERGQIQTVRQIDGAVTSIERRGGETVFFCNEVFELGMG